MNIILPLFFTYTPVLRQLHWLPVKHRIDFKLAACVYRYKSLHGFAPPYLSDDCQLVTDVGRRHLRSSDIYTCVVPWTQSQIGDSNFSVARPRLWNNLLTEIRKRDIISFEHYTRLLKAFFVRLGCGALWLLLKCARYKHCYSLTHILLPST